MGVCRKCGFPFDTKQCIPCKKQYARERYMQQKQQYGLPRPYTRACQQCGAAYKASKKDSKFCSFRCAGLSKAEVLVQRNKARRKYEPSDTLSKAQQTYRAHGGKYRLKDIERRHELLQILGGRCVTCGYNADIRGLVLDHKLGDGAADRRARGTKLARYYINHIEEARTVLQVLCATCNQIKALVEKEHNKTRRVVL